MGNKLILINAEDWEVLYLNDISVFQSHRIDTKSLIGKMNELGSFTIKYYQLNELGFAWLGQDNDFPINIQDIPSEYYD